MKRGKEREIAVKLGIMMLFIALSLCNMKMAYAAENNDTREDASRTENDSPQENSPQNGESLNASLLQIAVDGGDVVAYIECSEKPDSIEAQIAQYPCENVQVYGSEDILVHTIIMLDNSLSVTEENRENIKDILRRYVGNLPEQEMVSLAVFGEDIQFLCEKSQDTEKLLSMIEEIEFHDQDTYLTDYLYQELEKIAGDPVYTRFIVISDGVDNKTIGITKDELYGQLEKIVRPIYTIGHIYKDNTSELKNLFALSRVTGGKELLIEDFNDNSLVADKIHDFTAIYSCRMNIPQDVMDGADRHVLLNIHTQKGDMEVTGSVPMPFGVVKKESEEPVAESLPEPETKKVEELVVEPEPSQELTVEEEETEDSRGQSAGEKFIVPVLVLVIAAAILLLYLQKKKSAPAKAKKKREVPAIPKEPEAPQVQEAEEGETVLLEGRYLLVLRDRMDTEKIFRYPMDNHVIVGRNIDRVQIAVDYSLTISGQHCEFYVRSNRFFIRDMNSANHTYLNGKQINGEAEIISGSTVRLGEVEFNVEIMPL